MRAVQALRAGREPALLSRALTLPIAESNTILASVLTTTRTCSVEGIKAITTMAAYRTPMWDTTLEDHRSRMPLFERKREQRIHKGRGWMYTEKDFGVRNENFRLYALPLKRDQI